MTHGTIDDFITPHNSIAYYRRQQAQFGGRLDSFLKFYVIPGLGHGFGVFNAKIDALPALQQWVEQGKTPSGLTAVDGNANANRTRPLCEYPRWPKFTGPAGTESAWDGVECARVSAVDSAAVTAGEATGPRRSLAPRRARNSPGTAPEGPG